MSRDHRHGRRRAMVRTLFVSAALGALLHAPFAGADKPVDITDAEMALLPPYCPDTQTFGSGAGEYALTPKGHYWVSVMGPGFWYVHHYCWALINLQRAQKPFTSTMLRDNLREYAIGDMNFVLQHVPPDFIVLPEIYTKIGETQLELKRAGDARAAFAAARKLKADYWPAYSREAQWLIRSGRKDEARKLVEEGLANAPESRNLQQLYQQLGGDPAKVAKRASVQAEPKQ